MPHVRLSTQCQNLELYYDVHGSGQTKILLIMGLLADARDWVCQTDFFRDQPEYQCVSYDHRGCGRSSSPFTLHYTTTQMAKDALGLVDHLKWTQCHVVGLSMGGMIAVEFALLAPERVLSLTLIATHAGGIAGFPPFIGIHHMFRAFVIREEHLQVENSLAMLYGPKVHGNPERRQEFVDFYAQRSRKSISSPLTGILGHLFAIQRHYVSYADLLKLRYSPFDCLIIVGTEDRLIREANSYMIRQTLGCRLLKLEHAGHGLPGECAKEINEELFNWYELIRTSGSSKPKREVPEDYKIEIEAVEQCCEHRTHCLIHDIVGCIQGLLLGVLLYILLAVLELGRSQLNGIHFSFESVILFGCINGLRRSVTCVYHALHARQYVHKHQLLLDRAAHHGGVGVALPEEAKNGIPHGCGFEYPTHSIMLIIGLIVVMYSTTVTDKKLFNYFLFHT